eukprot:5475919-Prymnesium_polylepis.1
MCIRDSHSSTKTRLAALAREKLDRLQQLVDVHPWEVPTASAERAHRLCRARPPPLPSARTPAPQPVPPPPPSAPSRRPALLSAARPPVSRV